MRILLLVGTGGFLGSILRYVCAVFIQNKFLSAFPIGTLGVNIIGCFAIGVIFGWSEKFNMSAEWRLFLVTGICGGFTTFSAFSMETLWLLREGQLLYGFLYIAASVMLGLLASFIGFALLKI